MKHKDFNPLLDTQQDVAAMLRTLRTLIVWIAQSAGSPLSVDNANQLLAMLPPEKE